MAHTDIPGVSRMIGSKDKDVPWYTNSIGSRLGPSARKLLEEYSHVPAEQVEDHIYIIVCLPPAIYLPLHFPPANLNSADGAKARTRVANLALPLHWSIPLPRPQHHPKRPLHHTPTPAHQLKPDVPGSGLLFWTRLARACCSRRAVPKSLCNGPAARLLGTRV